MITDEQLLDFLYTKHDCPIDELVAHINRANSYFNIDLVSRTEIEFRLVNLCIEDESEFYLKKLYDSGDLSNQVWGVYRNSKIYPQRV